MKFENFKRKVTELVMSAHPGEDLDIRNGSKLFRTLQSDLLAKRDLARQLSEAQIALEKLKDV